jgi:hypothetical protein
MAKCSKVKIYWNDSKNQICIHEEIKSRFNSDTVRYRSIQNRLSSRLVSKYLSITIHKTIILPVVLYGYDAWSLALREKHVCIYVCMYVRMYVCMHIVGVRVQGVVGPKGGESSWRLKKTE